MHAWYVANRVKVLAKAKARYARTRDRDLAKAKARHARPEVKARNKVLAAARSAAHPEQKTAKAAARRAAKLCAFPQWADKQAIREVYVLRDDLTEVLGVVHHVDHIVPLRGRGVCGLHVAANLQVVTKAENLAKAASWWPDMPDEPRAA